MKTLILTLSLLICLDGWSLKPIPNRTPATAIDLCYPPETIKKVNMFDIGQSFDVTGTAACKDGKTKLFYAFHNTINYNVSSRIVGVNCASSYTMKLYGPFADFSSGASMVSAGTAPVYMTGTFTGQQDVNGIISAGSVFILEVEVSTCDGAVTILGGLYKRSCKGIGISPCEDCLPSFTPGEKEFVLSAWVSEGANPNTKTTFSLPAIEITVNATNSVYTFHASGQVIDGWQRIEGIFPSASNGDITLKFKAGAESTYFDDVRIFPNDGSMMSYVYDPVTLRLVAELDERNYAKFYEYDEEGKLIRVKKETAAGIMTITETRENSSLKTAE